MARRVIGLRLGGAETNVTNPATVATFTGRLVRSKNFAGTELALAEVYALPSAVLVGYIVLHRQRRGFILSSTYLCTKQSSLRSLISTKNERSLNQEPWGIAPFS